MNGIIVQIAAVVGVVAIVCALPVALGWFFGASWLLWVGAVLSGTAVVGAIVIGLPAGSSGAPSMGPGIGAALQVGLALGVALVGLACGSLAVWRLATPREMPGFDDDNPRETVSLSPLALEGKWPRNYTRAYEGWDVTRDEGGVRVRPGLPCDHDGELRPCATRFPRPSMSLSRADGPGEFSTRLVGEGGRELQFDTRSEEGFRRCESVLTGVLALDGKHYTVECSYTVENWCGDGGQWCLPLLSALHTEGASTMGRKRDAP